MFFDLVGGFVAWLIFVYLVFGAWGRIRSDVRRLMSVRPSMSRPGKDGLL